MQNARLHESEAGIKISRRNIDNLKHAADTTLMAESEEEQKSLLRRVKEEFGKAGLKLNIKKKKTKNKKKQIIAPCPITSGQTEGEKVESVTDFTFLDSRITAHGDCNHEIKRHLSFQG